MTAQGVYVNAAHNTASLQSTALTFNNSIDGNSSQFGTNGFSSQTHDGRHIEFSSDRIMAGNQQIHDVARGVDNTDAVNVAQLKEVESKITNINSDVINHGRIPMLKLLRSVQVRPHWLDCTLWNIIRMINGALA